MCISAHPCLFCLHAFLQPDFIVNMGGIACDAHLSPLEYVWCIINAYKFI